MLIMLRRGMDSRVKSDTIVLVLNLMDIGQVSLLRGYVCTYWVGIQCNKNGTRVIVVHLPGVGLYGSTPVKSIEKLDALQVPHLPLGIRTLASHLSHGSIHQLKHQAYN
ncbi:probable inactive receptor kinase At5g58300 isoform X4 [Daucus carota subsp. sativus]|uniref:probable inactive receptor kinase At5g58300 isoform X4 n=1 Tax=Daucus carota subsp. sativus TaxID=79200 RepID=UPI003082AB88